MAVRGQYTAAQQKMVADTNRTADSLVGWLKTPEKLVATAESIKNVAFAVDYWNPLWRDENYAMNTRWGGIIAPPMYQERYGMGHFSPEATDECGYRDYIYIGEDWEFFKPIRPGDTFRVWRNRPFMEDITKLDGTGPLMFKVKAHDYLHINQKDELVSTFKLYLQCAFLPQLKQRAITMPGTKHKYTQAELDFIVSLEEGEEIRGADIRYWEDVSVGDVPKPIVMGPTTISDMATYNAGAVGAFPPMRTKDRIKTPWEFTLDPETNVTYFSAEHHYSDRAAQIEGIPQAFHFGAWARQMMARVVTNWMGDDGFMTKFNWRHVTTTPIGDTVIGRAEVTGKRVQNDEHLVDLAVWLENIRGYVTEVASATVSLCSKESPYVWK
jgi:acyl dehydratase